MNFLNEIFSNYIAQAALWGWFIAQAIKFVIVLLQAKRFQWERLVGSGGFPSSHTSLVIALTTALGYKHGLGSDLFVIALVFSLIVMYDASGVRREAGRQAQILNQLLTHFKSRDIPVYMESGRMLKELLGHTPFEVFGGAILGYIVASVMYYNFI
ncbi:divergent PAP2 family protein [uncultured Veillonella sp.]|uniref:divergent PAP2 family protein n=1 Tax=uncultured Veillonella sp. TaxID=159268 RepID=UPI0026385EC4|nr:divergent PAP2 family protein [uncultured Veillonella sp.]